MGGNMMTSKEMVYASIEGKALEHYPVHTAYLMLAHADHWSELTGLQPVEFYKWLIADPEEHIKMYRHFAEKWPFDTFQPSNVYRTLAERENMEVVEKDNKIYYHHKKEDTYEYMNSNIHENGLSGHLVEERLVFDKNDVKEIVKIEKAETFIASGKNDYLQAAIKGVGDDKFIINGGILNTFYNCSHYVGLTNLFTLIYDEPELIHYLSERILEKNIEIIRAYAAAGGDAIYIDDATSTSDMISRATYEEFCLPYIKRAIDEIHHLGKKAVSIYFGGIQDRATAIASSGVDIVLMETKMKNFVNDYETVFKAMGGKVCLMGNLNPYDEIEILNDDELYLAIKKQVDVGRKYGKFISCTGSPLTPNTPASRIRKFVDIAHNL